MTNTYRDQYGRERQGTADDEEYARHMEKLNSRSRGRSPGRRGGSRDRGGRDDDQRNDRRGRYRDDRGRGGYNEEDRGRYRDTERDRGGGRYGGDDGRGSRGAREGNSFFNYNQHSSFNGDDTPQLPHEDRAEWRARIRRDCPAIYKNANLWARSPSPPAKTKKTAAAKKVPEKRKGHGGSGRGDKGRKKRRRARSPSSDSSSSSSDSDTSSSSSSSSESDSSSDERKKRARRKKKRIAQAKLREKEERERVVVAEDDVQVDYDDIDERVERRGDGGLPVAKGGEREEGGDAVIGAPERPTEAGRSAGAEVETAHLNHLDVLEKQEAERFRSAVQGRGPEQSEDESEDEVGPAPLVQPKDYAEEKKMQYGGALLPGEGAAIAQFVQQNLRIPRRGEIGWAGEEIESLETQGYVMSGSRHARMNAVRIRKENQVYSAEEKRALAMITFEEKQQKENKVIGDFRAMLTQRSADLDSAGGGEVKDAGE